MSLEWLWYDGFSVAGRLYKKQLEINKQLSEENARLREQLKGKHMHVTTTTNSNVFMSEKEILEVLTAHARKIANIPESMELEDSWLTRPAGEEDNICFRAAFMRDETPKPEQK